MLRIRQSLQLVHNITYEFINVYFLKMVFHFALFYLPEVQEIAYQTDHLIGRRFYFQRCVLNSIRHRAINAVVDQRGVTLHDRHGGSDLMGGERKKLGLQFVEFFQLLVRGLDLLVKVRAVEGNSDNVDKALDRFFFELAQSLIVAVEAYDKHTDRPILTDKRVNK